MLTCRSVLFHQNGKNVQYLQKDMQLLMESK